MEPVCEMCGAKLPEGAPAVAVVVDVFPGGEEQARTHRNVLCGRCGDRVIAQIGGSTPRALGEAYVDVIPRIREGSVELTAEGWSTKRETALLAAANIGISPVGRNRHELTQDVLDAAGAFLAWLQEDEPAADHV